MDFENKLKNRTIIAVLSVLLILCAFYFTLEIRNQKEFIDWKIQKENELVNIEVKNLLQSTNQMYRDKIKYFVNNPEIKLIVIGGFIETPFFEIEFNVQYLHFPSKFELSITEQLPKLPYPIA